MADDLAQAQARDVRLLVQAIERLAPAALPRTVKFSDVFADAELEQQLESLMQTLKAARKQGLLTFEGQMLLQGVNDDVPISLVEPAVAGDTAEVGEPPEPGSLTEIHYSDGKTPAQYAMSKAAFLALEASGAVTGETIVWKEGWEEWTPLSKCRERLALDEPEAAEPAPQPAAEPAAGGEEAALTGKMQVQWNGKGGFQRVYVEMTSTTLTMSKGKKGVEVLCSASTAGATVALPKNERKGHPHSFRVDLKKTDSKGNDKYICSVADSGMVSQWMQAFKYGVQVNPLAFGGGGKRSSTGGPSLLDSAKGIASAEGKSLDGKLSALAEKGGVHSEALSMLSGVSTPEEAIAAMKTDKAFADQVKTLAMTYVKDAVQAIDIPPIEGEKEWGTYAIKGLGIADIEIDPEKLSIDVTDCMYVSLADIAVTFTQFDFDFDKHSFPKVKDVGVASATATFDAFVKFDIVVNDDMITVDKVEAEVTIGDLPVDVLGGKHKFLYNMLLSLFSAKVKEAVGNDIKKQVDDSIPTLKEKIAAVTAGFSPDLKGKIKGVDLKGTVSRAVKNPDDEFDPDAVAMANQLNGQLVKDVEAHKKTQVVISNPTPYSFKIKDRPEMPTQGTWIVPPPERIRPNETNVVFGSASKGSSSGTKGTVEYVAKVDGRDQTIKLSYTNPVGSKATSTIETSTAAIEPVTWVTASNFSKAAFDIKLPMEDLDCVDLRNSAMFPDELPHHEDYDQRVRRLAGDTVSKSMTRLTEIAASPSAREAPVEPDHSDDLVVHIASWNCGNAPPPVPEKMDPWVPNGGRGADIIVVCTQECTYDAQKKIQEEILGKLQVTVQKASGFPGDYDDDCDRYVELSIEPDASAGKVKKAPATEGQTKVVKAEANPEFNERVQVMEKDGSLSDEGFSVFPSSARLTVRLMSEKGRKKVLLAEGEYSLLTCLNGELSHEQTEVEVALTHQEGATACEGAIALGLSYDLHLEATKLEEQVDFSRQAAASVEEQKAGAETAPGNIGILRISVLRAEGLTSDSTSMATARVTASGGVGDSIDPQVRLHVGPQTANTKTLEATTAPEWKEEFAFNLADVTLDELKLEIVNVEDDTEQFYGSITVPTKQFIDSSNSGDHHIFTDEEHQLELDTGSVLYIKAAFEAGATVQAQGAAEEDEDDEDGEGETEDSVHFFNTCKLAAGSQYYEVGRQVLWQIQMIVLAKVEKRPHISGVELRKVKTGLVGGLIANKGGVVCKLVYKGHELAFVNTHLAAHEGIEFRQDRNRMAAEVQASARVGNRAIDLGNQFHHSFWAGDLNYRVEFKDWVNADGTLNKAVTKDEKMLQVKRIIDQEKWPVLWAADELRRELAAGRAFAGFQDGICDFPPTFKVEKGYVLQYNPKRVPSYCDRILWRSTEGYDACIHQEAFAAAPNLITSDHKPVWARYRISVPETLTARQRRVAQPSKVVVRLRNVAVEGLNADLTTSRLVVHDEELLNNDTAAMTNLSGDEGMVMPTRVSCSATLQGRVQDPSDASRASSSQFSHAVVLQVEETGAMSGTDLGYATMALRDAEAEETVQLDASEAAEWNSHKKLRGKILHGPLFPLFRRQVRLPLSLNGVNTGGYLGACLEVAESYTPLYVLDAPTSLRMGIEKTTDTVCQLAAGDRVTVLNRKKRDGEVRLRVRMWLPAPARQEGWISEASADKQTLAAKTDVCAHRIWRPPSLRRGWALKKDGGAAWERVWCQSEDGTKVAFFESNDAGEGGAAVGELPVADVEEATLPTGAAVAAAGDTGLELKMKDGRMVRMHYDTEPDRTMWLAVLAPQLVAAADAGGA